MFCLKLSALMSTINKFQVVPDYLFRGVIKSKNAIFFLLLTNPIVMILLNNSVLVNECLQTHHQ